MPNFVALHRHADYSCIGLPATADHHQPVMWSETVGLRSRPVRDKKMVLVLYAVVLVLVLHTVVLVLVLQV